MLCASYWLEALHASCSSIGIGSGWARAQTTADLLVSNGHCARANLKGQQIIPGRHARLLMQCFGLSVSAHVQSDIMLSIYLHED